MPSNFLPSMVLPAQQGGKLATGEDAPTMDWYNPQWAQWFDSIKNASGGENPIFGPDPNRRQRSTRGSKGLPVSLQALDGGGQ